MQERLSSGQRINRASDDAAGLAIASRLKTDTRLYTSASRNVNDGVSVLSVIDGALAQQTGILQRLSELAEQSANGTFSAEQREALNNEYGALLKEFSRIAESTSFNGQRLLQKDRSSGLQQILLQAGIDGGVDSLLAVSGTDTGSLSGSLDALNLSAWTTNNWAPGGGPDVLSVRTMVGLPLADMLDRYFNAFKVAATDSGGTVRDFYFVTTSFGGSGAIPVWKDKMGVAVFTTDPDSGEVLTTRVNGGFCAQISTDPATGKIVTSQQQYTVNITEIYESGGAGPEVALGLTAGFAVDLRALSVRADMVDSTIDFTGVESVARARKALTAVSNRMTELASIRGSFGAALSRLQTANANLLASRENVAAAESRIMDADITAEAAEGVRNSILQQTASAVLAQANQAPALALQLLRA